MNQLHRSVMAALAGQAQAGAWDQHPVLYRLHLRDGEARLHPMAISDEMWEHARPPEVLELVARMMVANGFRARPDDPDGELLGMAFGFEGWWVEAEESDPRATHRMNKMAGEGRLYQHPDRVEMRVMVAVDRHGATYQVRHLRDRGIIERLVMVPGRTEHQAAGAIVEALDLMVQALTGAPAQQRPSAYAETTEGMN